MHDFRCKKVNRKQMQKRIRGNVSSSQVGVMLVGGGLDKARVEMHKQARGVAEGS